jgi:hypothetical protein
MRVWLDNGSKCESCDPRKLVARDRDLAAAARKLGVMP